MLFTITDLTMPAAQSQKKQTGLPFRISFMPLPALILGCLIQQAASASFIVESTPVVTPTQAAAAPTPSGPVQLVPQGGKALAGWDEVVTGFGKPQKLAVVLAQLVPQGVSYHLGSSVDGGMMVSWKGSKTRRLALSDALTSHGLGLKETDGANVLIEVAEIDVRTAKAQPGAQEAPVAADGTDDGAAASQQWIATAGSTLRETLQKWADAAGWQIDWRAKDRQFGGSASFTGSYEQASKSLILLYASGKSPIRAWFHRGNHMLEVWNASEQGN